MNSEQKRLRDTQWKKWGPYVSERQWGTVREDYSADGHAWDTLRMTWPAARHTGGEKMVWRVFATTGQLLCFALALWNKKDPIIKERLFGLQPRGQSWRGCKGTILLSRHYAHPLLHEDVVQVSASGISLYPLVEENGNRDRLQPEFELIDTGIFDEDKYFDVFIEYAKADEMIYSLK